MDHCTASLMKPLIWPTATVPSSYTGKILELYGGKKLSSVLFINIDLNGNLDLIIVQVRYVLSSYCIILVKLIQIWRIWVLE